MLDRILACAVEEGYIDNNSTLATPIASRASACRSTSIGRTPRHSGIACSCDRCCAARTRFPLASLTRAMVRSA